MEKGFRTVAATVFAVVFLCRAAPPEPLAERLQEFFAAHSVHYGAIAYDPALSVLTIEGLSWREPGKQRLFRLNSLVLSDIGPALVDAVTDRNVDVLSGPVTLGALDIRHIAVEGEGGILNCAGTRFRDIELTPAFFDALFALTERKEGSVERLVRSVTIGETGFGMVQAVFYGDPHMSAHRIEFDDATVVGLKSGNVERMRIEGLKLSKEFDSASLAIRSSRFDTVDIGAVLTDERRGDFGLVDALQRHAADTVHRQADMDFGGGFRLGVRQFVHASLPADGEGRKGGRYTFRGGALIPYTHYRSTPSDYFLRLGYPAPFLAFDGQGEYRALGEEANSGVRYTLSFGHPDVGHADIVMTMQPYEKAVSVSGDDERSRYDDSPAFSLVSYTLRYRDASLMERILREYARTEGESIEAVRAKIVNHFLRFQEEIAPEATKGRRSVAEVIAFVRNPKGFTLKLDPPVPLPIGEELDRRLRYLDEEDGLGALGLSFEAER